MQIIPIVQPNTFQWIKWLTFLCHIFSGASGFLDSLMGTVRIIKKKSDAIKLLWMEKPDACINVF